MPHGPILIADDHAIVRVGLMMLIRQVLPQANILQAKNLGEAIALLKEYSVELIVCDINIPGGNSFDMIRYFKAIRPDLKILVLTEFQTASYEKKFMKQGASGYLSKKVTNEEMQQAIHSILQDGSYPNTNDHKRSIEPGKTPAGIMELLSYREAEVSRLLLRGMGILEIARTLNLQCNTVSTYKKRIFEKLNVTSLADFVLLLAGYSDSPN